MFVRFVPHPAETTGVEAAGEAAGELEPAAV
jgi:hypothetical protein